MYEVRAPVEEHAQRPGVIVTPPEGNNAETNASGCRDGDIGVFIRKRRAHSTRSS